MRADVRACIVSLMNAALKTSTTHYVTAKSAITGNEAVQSEHRSLAGALKSAAWLNGQRMKGGAPIFTEVQVVER